MMHRPITRRAFLKLSAAGAGALAAAPRAGITPAFAAPGASTVVYEDFSGGEAGYNARWFQYTTGPLGEPVGSAAQPYTRTFPNAQLQVSADPFTMSYDNVDDHIKYLAVSHDTFAIPQVGSIMVAADITAQTPGAVAGRVLPTTGSALFEGQQATVTLHMLDFGTGAILDWLISGNRALALYERLFTPGVVDLDKGYTQILGAPNFTGQGTLAPPLPGTSSRDFVITPGPHNYAMRYTRNAMGNAPDLVEWLIDGVVVARVNHVGIPLDVQFPAYRAAAAPIRYPSVGPGQEMKTLLQGFNIGHGLFSLVDEFPFNQYDYNRIAIPPQERLWGQGAVGTWDNVTVTTLAAR